MKTKGRRTLVTLGLISALTIAIPLTGYLAIVQPGGSGVLGSVKTPDGCEYRIEQTCNWIPFEAYTVDFFMRDPDGKWGWCYIDHEADRWRDVKVSYDANQDCINITERGVLRVSLDRKTSTFTLDNGSIRRSGTIAPQTDRNPHFASQ